MIAKCIERFDAARPALLAGFMAAHPEDYAAIVKAVITAVTRPDAYREFCPDPERIHQIDDGDYQGTLLFVIAEKGDQPSTYYAVAVGYGSCSGCDTLEAIRSHDKDPPTAAQAAEYLTLALHIAQGLRQISGYDLAGGDPV